MKASLSNLHLHMLHTGFEIRAQIEVELKRWKNWRHFHWSLKKKTTWGFWEKVISSYASIWVQFLRWIHKKYRRRQDEGIHVKGRLMLNCSSSGGFTSGMYVPTTYLSRYSQSPESWKKPAVQLSPLPPSISSAMLGYIVYSIHVCLSTRRYYIQHPRNVYTLLLSLSLSLFLCPNNLNPFRTYGQ
jgi:hypothetical protein